MKLHNSCRAWLFACLAFLIFPAQIFSKTYTVDQKHASASDQNDGSSASPLKTISAGASKAQAGDTVFVKEGIYRERVTPPRGGSSGKPVVYLAEQGKKVYIKGSELWKPQWTKVDGQDNVYKATPDASMFTDNLDPGGSNPYHISVSKDPTKIENPDKIITLGQVFVNGKKLQQLAIVDKVNSTPGTWTCQYKITKSDEILVHFPEGTSPDNAEVELTARRRVFAPKTRGLGYITIIGFIMEHCANQFPWPQAGLVGCRAGHHWVIDNNTIRHANTCGLDIGHEGDGKSGTIGHHTITNNAITDNGSAGILGIESPNSVMRGNFIAYNNDLHFEAVEQAGIKLHKFYDGVIENNLFFRNYDKGLWLDNEYDGARVNRNIFIQNAKTGLMFELAHTDKCIFDNNVLYNNYANNIYSHDGSGMTMAHNLIINCTGQTLTGKYGEGYFGRVVTSRSKAFNKWNYVYNSILANNVGGDLKMAYPGGRTDYNVTDYNVFEGTQDSPNFRVHRQSGAGNSPPWGTDKETRDDNFWGLICDAIGSDLCTGIDDVKETGRAGSRLNFEQWKAFWKTHETNNEQNSMMVQGITADFNFATFELILNIPFDPSTFKTKDVDKMDKDFFGNPITAGSAIVGPFQNLKQGKNVFKLWGTDRPHDPDALPVAHQAKPSRILPTQRIETRMLSSFSAHSPMRIDAKQVDIYSANGRKLYSIKAKGNAGINLAQHKAAAQGVLMLKIIR